MDFRDLEYFIACCKAGSFTAAAREVHIVQSAMSHSIARLEQDLGAPLFDRSATPIVLTDQGTAMQGAAQRILDALAKTSMKLDPSAVPWDGVIWALALRRQP